MGKGHRTCEICGIKEAHVGTSGEKRLLFSQFPLNPDRCREWLRVTGNEELVHLPIEKLHGARNVCGNHFQRRDFNKKGNRLKRHAIPSLNLSTSPLSDLQLAEFPQHIARDRRDSPQPSTSGIRQQCQQPLAQIDNSLNLPTLQPSNLQIKPSTSKLKENVQQSFTVSSQQQLISANKSQSQQPLTEMENISTIPPLQLSDIQIKPSTSHQKENDQESRNVETPREKKLLKQLQRTKCTLKSLKRSAKLIENLDSTVLKEIVASALKNQNRKVQGRRWTPKNKISCLAIFKRSPKVYAYLRNLMPLPSIKTLQNLLKKIPMEPGIHKSVLEHLKKNCSNIKSNDRYCALVFDEIALKRRLIYNAASDKIEGYQDFGGGDSGRSAQIADHGLVFMLQGLKAKFKQPVAFYYVKGTVSSQKLACLIKEIIEAVEETGFKVLLTICDQGPTNMGALNMLKENDNNFFKCGDSKVYIIYDVPHLFKSIRNNFLNYGELLMCGKKAKWSHLLKVEEKNRNLLYLSKISATHVQPKFRAKMKVKLAAQILSNTVAAVLKLLAENEKDPLQAEIMETGCIVEDLDRLFDKTNGPSGPDDIKRGRRENVSAKTDHPTVWSEYIQKLETLKFQKSNGIAAKNVRCIQGYITTLRSLRDVWTEVSRLGFKYLNLRQLNQDALENLFGVIRQHSPTNRNPTCSSFTAALKTSIVSGLTAPHNRGFNCQKDSAKLLNNLHDLVFTEPNQDQQIDNSIEASAANTTYVESENENLSILSIPEEFENDELLIDLTEVDKQPVVYVSGYIASRILKKYTCSTCSQILKVDDPADDPIYSYIKLREWWKEKSSLTYPSIKLCRLVDEASFTFENDVIPFLHFTNISKYCITQFMAKCDIKLVSCEIHLYEILSLLTLSLIRRQCRRENEKLAIQEEKLADSVKKAQQQGTCK